MRKLALGMLLLVCAGSAAAQTPVQRDSRDSTRNSEWRGRVPRDGVAPLLDIRLQDSGVALPAEHKEDEAPKPAAKPEAAPAPRPAEQPAPPAPSK